MTQWLPEQLAHSDITFSHNSKFCGSEANHHDGAGHCRDISCRKDHKVIHCKSKSNKVM